jgi:hypothetical protein
MGNRSHSLRFCVYAGYSRNNHSLNHGVVKIEARNEIARDQPITVHLEGFLADHDYSPSVRLSFRSTASTIFPVRLFCKFAMII